MSADDKTALNKAVTDIASNTSKISTNTSNIATNTSNIAKKQDKIKAGSNITIADDGVTISATAAPYTLPTATNTRLGGIKVGTNLTVTNDGTVSATVPTITEYTDAEWRAFGFVTT